MHSNHSALHAFVKALSFLFSASVHRRHLRTERLSYATAKVFLVLGHEHLLLDT